MVLALPSQVQQLQEENQQLLEQFKLAQQKQFGASSEGHPGQGELFDEAEIEVEQNEPETESISYERKGPNVSPCPKTYREK